MKHSSLFACRLTAARKLGTLSITGFRGGIFRPLGIFLSSFPAEKDDLLVVLARSAETVESVSASGTMFLKVFIWRAMNVMFVCRGHLSPIVYFYISFFHALQAEKGSRQALAGGYTLYELLLTFLMLQTNQIPMFTITCHRRSTQNSLSFKGLFYTFHRNEWEIKLADKWRN